MAVNPNTADDVNKLKVYDLKAYNLEDLKKLDVQQLAKVDPEKIKLGTDLQDGAMIAQAFERGAHYTPKEVAVFATLNRHLDNYRTISKSTSNMLKTYVMVPENSVSQQMSEGQNVAEKALRLAQQDEAADILFPSTPTADPAAGQAFAQSLGLKNFEQSTGSSADFGDKFSKWLSDCIPCDLRISSWFELNPNIDLAGILRAALSGILDFLNGIGNLLRNLDVFGDFCALMDLFNFTCIPDLQRILMLLATLLAFEMPQLDGLITLVQALIAPLFAPILTAIMGLFDQFMLLVTNPLECIVDAINQQIQKLPRSDNPIFGTTGTDPGLEGPPEEGQQDVPGLVAHNANFFGASTESTRAIREKEQAAVALKEEWVDQPTRSAVEGVNAMSQSVGESLSVLKSFIQDTIAMLKEKMKFYLGDLQSLLGEMASNDASYIAQSMRKMQIIRLISFITALIAALASGNLGFCRDGGKAEAHEIDNFYNNYLGPNMSFDVAVDEQGNLNFREKDDRFAEQYKKALPNRQNVFEFEGKDVTDEQISEVARVLTQPIEVTKPCRLEVTAAEADTLNRYISELNEL
jgi:hypothetical protein